MKWTDKLEPILLKWENQEELMNELYKQMFVVAYSKMRNKSDALDVVQESWIKILQKIDTLKDRSKLFHWVKVITSNTANNMIKRKQLMKNVIPFPYDESRAGLYQAPELELDDRFIRESIFDCIGRLDEKAQQMIKFKYFYGCSDEETAAMMKLPVGTVKAKIHRAKSRLRHILTTENSIR